MAGYVTYGSDSSQGVDVDLHIIHEPPQGTAGCSTAHYIIAGLLNAYRSTRIASLNNNLLYNHQYNKTPKRSTSLKKDNMNEN
jgi:hypothetical protein